MTISHDELLSTLKNAFPDAIIELQDTIGDSNHYHLYIRSKQFNGKNKIQQHKIVYNALDGLVGGRLHAIQIKTEGKNDD